MLDALSSVTNDATVIRIDKVFFSLVIFKFSDLSSVVFWIEASDSFSVCVYVRLRADASSVLIVAVNLRQNSSVLIVSQLSLITKLSSCVFLSFYGSFIRFVL